MFGVAIHVSVQMEKREKKTNYLLIPILDKISEVASWFLNVAILSQWLPDPNCFFFELRYMMRSCDPNSYIVIYIIVM